MIGMNCWSAGGVVTIVVAFAGGGEMLPAPGGHMGGDVWLGHRMLSSSCGGGGRERSDESEGSLFPSLGPSMSLESFSLTVELSLIHI